MDLDHLKKTVGQRLRKVRRENDLTGTEVGNACNITPQNISGIERFRSLPSMPVLIAYSELFNKDPAYMAGLTDYEFTTPKVHNEKLHHTPPAISFNNQTLMTYNINANTLIQFQSQQDVDTVHAGDFVFIDPSQKNGRGVFLIMPQDGAPTLKETVDPDPSRTLGKVIATLHFND